MGFLENLSIRYNALTKQGKRLADFIIDNQSETIKMTAKALGAESGTSAAAVIRFCHQLGYESFEQMKIGLAKDGSVEELGEPIDTIITAGDSVPDIAHKLYHNQISALLETMKLMEYDEIQKTISLIQKASTVYLFGVGSSGLVALELCHRLNRIGKPCVFLLDSHTNLAYSAVASKKDIVIGFSYSGETKEVCLAAERANKNGVPVVAVTRNRKNSLSAWANINIAVPDIEKRVRVGAFASTISQMLIADVLYMGLLQKDYDKYEHMLVETSRIANRLRE